MASHASLFDLLAAELEAMRDYKPAEGVVGRPAQLIDVLFAYRLLLGRWPEFAEATRYRERLDGRTLEYFCPEFVRSTEFKTRFPEDPGFDLDVMAELPDRLRLWFNWRDRQAVRIVTGVHEPSTREAIRRILRPGMHCLDIGAHIGLYTLIMAQMSGPDGRIFAFEPFPASHALLVKNVRENRFTDSAAALPLAASDREGYGRIFVPVARDLGPTFVPVRDGVDTAQGLEGMEIELARADSLVPDDLRIGLVKMDIEGGEPRALRGMERIVSRDRPILMTEFNPYCLRHMDESDPADYLAQLRAHGYRLYEDAEFLASGNREFVYDPNGETVNLVCLPTR